MLLEMKNQSLEYFLNLKYPISIYPGDEGGYTAISPDLPGCMTQGETLEKVVIILRRLVSYGYKQFI